HRRHRRRRHPRAGPAGSRSQRIRHGYLKRVEQRRGLVVELDSDGLDLRDGETRELRARLIDRAPCRALGVLPDHVWRPESRLILHWHLRWREDRHIDREETVMAGVESRDFDSPDETRTPEKTRVDIVRIGGSTAGRFAFEPGWRWSECVKPVAGTESCQ